jgi:PUA domain protein
MFVVYCWLFGVLNLCPDKFRRYFLRGSEVKSVLDEVSGNLVGFVAAITNNKSSIEVVAADLGRIFLIGGKPLLFECGNRVFPTLMFEGFVSKAAKIAVDMGAVPHVCAGADVMAPGIVRYDGDFVKGDLVVVVDVKYGKPLLIGEALLDRVSAQKTAHGVILKNIHYVGDEVWKLLRKL